MKTFTEKINEQQDPERLPLSTIIRLKTAFKSMIDRTPIILTEKLLKEVEESWENSSKSTWYITGINSDGNVNISSNTGEVFDNISVFLINYNEEEEYETH